MSRYNEQGGEELWSQAPEDLSSLRGIPQSHIAALMGQKSRHDYHLKLQIFAFLKKHPLVRPYYKWNVHLEGTSNPSYLLAHSPLIFESRCGACVDHGTRCSISRSDASLKCDECRRFGGRCVYKNLNGLPLTREHVRNNCGRCILKLPYDRQVFDFEPGYRPILDLSLRYEIYYSHLVAGRYQEYAEEKKLEEYLSLDPYPSSLERRYIPYSWSERLFTPQTTASPSLKSSRSASTSGFNSPCLTPDGSGGSETDLSEVISRLRIIDSTAVQSTLDLSETETLLPRHEEVLRQYVLNQSAKRLLAIKFRPELNDISTVDVGYFIPDVFELKDEESAGVEELRDLDIDAYWEERLKRELSALKRSFWARDQRKYIK